MQVSAETALCVTYRTPPLQDLHQRGGPIWQVSAACSDEGAWLLPVLHVGSGAAGPAAAASWPAQQADAAVGVGRGRRRRSFGGKRRGSGIDDELFAHGHSGQV